MTPHANSCRQRQSPCQCEACFFFFCSHVVRSVDCTRLLISLLEISLPDSPELCRLRFVGSRWVSYTIFFCYAPPLLLVVPAASCQCQGDSIELFRFSSILTECATLWQRANKGFWYMRASCPSLIGLFNRFSLFSNAAAFCKFN